MADAAPDLAPFSVPVLIATSLDALISAATLHLGDPMPDGRRLDAPDPQEAWRALLAVQGLLAHAGPLMAEETIAPFRTAHAYLVQRLADAHPETAFPVPPALAAPAAQPAPAAPRGLPDIQAMAAAAVAEWQADEPDAPARPSATGPLKRPGTGLPTRGSSPLFPGK